MTARRRDCQYRSRTPKLRAIWIRRYGHLMRETLNKLRDSEWNRSSAERTRCNRCQVRVHDANTKAHVWMAPARCSETVQIWSIKSALTTSLRWAVRMLTLFCALYANKAAAGQLPTTIQVTSRVVNVEVAVTDRRTRMPVDNLRQQDFEVLDNGRPAAITYFSRPNQRDRPFVLELFVEVDNSIHPILPDLESNLREALLNLEPGDEVAVFAFDPYNFQRIQPLTSHREPVLQALSRAAELQQKKLTLRRYKKFEALPNALLSGIRYLQDRQPDARIGFVIIGSDFDVISGKLAEDVNQRLLVAGVTVAGLLKSDSQTTTARFMVKTMTLPSAGSARAGLAQFFAAQTGGETITVRGENYAEPLERIIGSVTRRYSLGFVPAGAQLDARFHRITVRVRSAAIRHRASHLQIRARRGYYANP